MQFFSSNFSFLMYIFETTLCICTNWQREIFNKIGTLAVVIICICVEPHHAPGCHRVGLWANTEPKDNPCPKQLAI